MSEERHGLHLAVIWAVFFAVCMGLGYPTLNRYDPRDVAGLYDARAYYAMVVKQPLQEDQVDLGHRVLVPYLARPVYSLFKNNLHTWNPEFFALLVVNAFFSATTALLIVVITSGIAGDSRVALLAAFLFLADFAVSNLNLSGYVDSAVNCLLMAVVWSLLTDRWWLLPAWGVLGALAKETFVPMSVLLAFLWWLSERKSKRSRISLIWIAALLVAGFAALALVMATVPQHESPLAFAASRHATDAGFLYVRGLLRCLTAREFLFTFGWLLPLGIWRLNRLPKPWVAGGAGAAMIALAMGAYDDALGNAARAVFSAAGPLLSISTAFLLTDLGGPHERQASVQAQK